MNTNQLLEHFGSGLRAGSAASLTAASFLSAFGDPKLPVAVCKGSGLRVLIPPAVSPPESLANQVENATGKPV